MWSNPSPKTSKSQQSSKKKCCQIPDGSKVHRKVHGCPIGCVEGGAPSRSVRAQAVLLAGFCWLGFVAPKEVHLPPKKVGTVIVNGTVHLCVYTVCINTVYI